MVRSVGWSQPRLYLRDDGPPVECFSRRCVLKEAVTEWARRVRALEEKLQRLEDNWRVDIELRYRKRRGVGFFYAVRLSPDRPSVVKLGFTTNINQRVDTFKTTNPTCDLIGVWRCKDTRQEKMVMGQLLSPGVPQVAGCAPFATRIKREVFGVPDVEVLCDGITKLLGQPLRMVSQDSHVVIQLPEKLVP
jgi:hypothetical protein